MTETHKIPVSGGESIMLDWTPPAEAPDTGMPASTAVFVHGLGSHRRGEKALYFQQRFAEKGWGYLTLDMRGHGESEGSMRDLSLSRCLEDLSAGLDWLKARGRAQSLPVLLGSSMGGAVAVWHHLAHPRQTGPMVLLAPALTFPGRFFWQLGPKELEAWRNDGVRRFSSDWLDMDIGFGLIDDAAQYDPQKLLKAHAGGTLIFHGMLDDSVGWRGSQTFMEDCPNPNMDLVLIKSGDHRLTEHKDFIFNTLWGWLQTRPAPE